jgi:hypothetical protein
MGTLREDVSTFVAVSCQIFLRMGCVLDRSCGEDENTHFIFNNFFSENCTVYEIMLKNMVETKGPQITSQYGAHTLHAGKARLHACMCMHLGTHMHARMHTQTNK